jgi:cytochrome c biogenesis protein
MLPVDMDGQRVFLLGARDTPGEPFRYLRVPADAQDSLDSFVRMRAALNDADMRRKAVQRYTAQAVEGQSADMGRALTVSAQRAIDLFAGVDPFLNDLPKTEDATGNPVALGGLQAVSAFMEANVPQAEREKAGDVLLRILNGTLFELLQLSQEGAGQPPVPRDDKTAAFMTQAVLGLSDAFFYPAPMTFMLQDFTQVQASVFQVARAPGKTIVYLGCLFLIIGVFAMLYVRERRLWVWLAPSGQGNATQALMALSTNRKMLDTDREFESLKTKLLEVHA